MKINIYATIVILFISSLIGMAKNTDKSNPNKNLVSINNLNVLEKAPNFSLKSIDGKNIKLSNFKGKIVIIDFWATWCGPCRKGIPDLIAIQKEFSKDVVIIGISLDRETAPDVKSFVKKNNINYSIAMYTDAIIESFGGVSAIPTSFVIDKKGNIVNKFVGLQDKSTYTDIIKKIK